MVESQANPSAAALEEVRRLAGPSAAIESVVMLEGGQHSATWKVTTAEPRTSVVVKQFPPGDPACERELEVLEMLDGLGGLAPAVLGRDLSGSWSEHPTSLTSWLDGKPDITPDDPRSWATELGETLATIHRFSPDRAATLQSVFEREGASRGALAGPLASSVERDWERIDIADVVLTHDDYWSGNVVWRHGRIAGVVDWSAGSRGPRGFDVSVCRLDLIFLEGEAIADVFLTAYEGAFGEPLADVELWDRFEAARTFTTVDTWAPNYAPFGRADLTAVELRRRHTDWTNTLLDRSA